jgi:hypothetical protein
LSIFKSDKKLIGRAMNLPEFSIDPIVHQRE